MAKRSEQTDLSFREKLLIKILFLVARIVSGRCYDGGVQSDIAEKINELEAEIMIGNVIISERKVTA